jgi:hypothetical protein
MAQRQLPIRRVLPLNAKNLKNVYRGSGTTRDSGATPGSRPFATDITRSLQSGSPPGLRQARIMGFDRPIRNSRFEILFCSARK